MDLYWGDEVTVNGERIAVLLYYGGGKWKCSDGKFHNEREFEEAGNERDYRRYSDSYVAGDTLDASRLVDVSSETPLLGPGRPVVDGSNQMSNEFSPRRSILD